MLVVTAVGGGIRNHDFVFALLGGRPVKEDVAVGFWEFGLELCGVAGFVDGLADGPVNQKLEEFRDVDC